MFHRRLVRSIGLVGLLLLSHGAGAEERSAAPAPAPAELAGLAAAGPAREFDADALYEYVNGDSFTYLGFGCRGLSVAQLAAAEGGKVTVERFDHGNPANAFGIYSYERPPQADLVEVGGQGYLDGERLVFFKGPYYVKLVGSGLGDGDGGAALLRRLAAALAADMPGEPGLPPLTGSFPEAGLVPGSLRYVTSDFLGHRFLRGAYVADYELGGDELTAFLIDAGSPAQAEAMLGDYLGFLDGKGVAHEELGGTRVFADPYHASSGLLRLERHGGFLLGTLGGGAESARRLREALVVALPAAAGD